MYWQQSFDTSPDVGFYIWNENGVNYREVYVRWNWNWSISAQIVNTRRWNVIKKNIKQTKTV